MIKTIRYFFCRVAFLWAFLALLTGGRAWAQVTNDDCASAVGLMTSSVCTVPVNGTVATATQSLPPTAACGLGLTTAADVWYSFTATSTNHLITLAPRFAAILDVRSGTCAASTSVFCTGIANNNTSAVSVGGLVGGQSYFIRVYPATNTPPTGISSTFALCIGQGATGPNNDDCIGAISVPVNTSGTCTNTISADNTLATSSVGAPAPTCGGYQGRDLWFSVVVPANGNITVQTVVASTGNDVGDTGMSIYSGTCGNLVVLGCDDDAAGNLKSLLAFSSRTPGEVLYIRVWSFNNQASGTIAVCATTPAPLGNDECVGAVQLPVTTACGAPVSGTLAGATQSLPPSATCSATIATANDVWYRFLATGATQTLTLNSSFFAAVEVRSGTCTGSASVFCGTVASGQGLTVSGLTGGQTYFLRVYNNINISPINLQFTICLTPGPTPATNDDCINAVTLPVTTGCTSVVSGTISGASQSLPPASCSSGGVTIANDVWYSFTASGATQMLTFNGGFQLVADIRSGNCANSSSVFCGIAFPNQPITVSGLTGGQIYFLRLYANNNIQPVVTTFTLCLTPGPTPPANDECIGAIPLAVATSCITPVAGTVAGASQSLPVTAACGFATNANDVWYRFVANGTSQTIAFTGNFGAVLEVRSGTCASSTSVFCGTVFNGQSVIATGLTNGQPYFLRVYANNIIPQLPTNSAFTLCVTAGPPASVNDECAVAVAVAVVQGCATSTNGTVAGASQSLPPTASCGTGISTAADVWYSFVASAPTQLITLTTRFAAVLDVRSGSCTNSTSVFCASIFANATTGTVVGGLTPNQTYFIRIYANGATQPLPANATFTLCISPAPTPPANDNCAGAIAVPVTAICATPVSGTVEAASQSLPPSTACGTTNILAQDVWYSFVANGSAQLVTLNARFAGVLEVHSGTCANSTSVACAAVFAGATTGTSIGGLTNGQTYFLRVYANSLVQPTAANATFTLCIMTAPTPPVNDDCAGAINVPVQFGNTCVSQTTADNTAATNSPAPAPGCASYQGRDVWFQVTVPASGTLTVRTVVPTVGTDIGDTGMSIYSGSCTALTQLGCDDDSGGNLKSLLTLTGRTPGEVLYVRIWGFNGTAMGTVAVCATAPTNCATPTALVSASITSATAQLSWQPGGTPAAGTTYAVEYGPQGFTIGTGTVISGLTTPNVQLTGLLSGTAYCFYVRQDCPSPNGSSAYAGPGCFATPCAMPTSLTATALTSTTAQLGWQTNGTPPNGTTYTLEYGPQGFTQGTGTVISGVPTTGFQLSNLQASTAYCFYVRQDCPGATGSGAFAGPSCFTTSAPSSTCASPGSLAASAASTTAQLSWQPVGTPGAGVTYTVQYGLQGFALGTGVVVPGIASPNYSLTGLAATTGYCFYVRQDCGGTNGSSAYVGPICFTTTTAAGGPANDDPCGAVTLGISTTGSPAPTLSGTNVGATTSAQTGIGTPTCSPSTAPRDVWFAITPAAASVTLTLTGAPAGMVRVFTAPSCSAGPFTLVTCRSSGTNNTGLSTASLTGLTPGQRYYVAVSGYGAADTPGAFTIAAGSTLTATRAQMDANALLVYPNPSSTGQLTLKLSTASFGPARANLVNALGQVVRTETLRSGSTEQAINTHGLATGIYTVRVVVGNEVLTRKVVLE